MKVAYVVPMTWTCGGTIVAFQHVEQLAARGHDVGVFTPEGRPPDWFPLRARVLPFPESPRLADHHDAVVFVGSTFRSLHDLPSRLRVLLLQGKDYLWVGPSERAALLEAYADPAYHILAVSKWLAEFARDRCGASGVTVLGNGVDTVRFHPSEEPREGFRILVEGNFPDAGKNVLEALEVASRVRQYHPVEVWALGKRFRSPGSLVKRLFVDPVQAEIPDIYRACDLLLKTSITEGFGLPHLEAMASGCVPAAYASGGVLDFCRHGENSLITGVGNVPQLVGHALRFFEDEGLRRRLRAGAIRTARAHDWSQVGERLEAVLKGLLGEA